MEVNFKYKKTKIMILIKSGKISYTWFYKENPIEIVNTFCYLGIVLSYTGSFSETQSILAQQGRKALFCLKQNQTLLKYWPSNEMWSFWSISIASFNVWLRGLGFLSR